MGTLKYAIRLKKGVPLCFPKGGIRVDHVFLLTPPQINRLDRTQTDGRRVQIRMSARQVSKNVSYTGGFRGMLTSLAAHAITLVLVLYRSQLVLCLPSLQLVYFLVVLTKRLVELLLEMDSIYTSMINAIEYRNLKAMVSI